VIGRFLSADSIVPDWLDPQTLNRFAYVQNNPLAFSDPSGHEPNNVVDANGYGPGPNGSSATNGNGNGPTMGGEDAENYLSLGLINVTQTDPSIQSSLVGDATTLLLSWVAVAQVPYVVAYEAVVTSPVWGPLAGQIGTLGPRIRQTIGAWASPNTGRQLINGREYTIHALERMAPRGLIQKGTEIMSRGVPPSVVENAIQYGVKSAGNMARTTVHAYENVTVVTNQAATRVITVITTGR
jgi:hypothetical protein